jgi:hypothetical protein
MSSIRFADGLAPKRSVSSRRIADAGSAAFRSP